MLSPAVAEVRRAVRDSLSDLSPGSVVLVACSGGADSLALAAACAFEAPRRGLSPQAVVVDHGIQPGSVQVAADAAGQLQGIGYDQVHVERVRVGTVGGTEAAARDARYAALRRTADTVGAVAVLLGHTLDDQAETVLLGLARGSGARSLSGMRPVSGRFRRPLLDVTRETTERACAAANLQPWADPHNQDPGFARVRVRNRVLPTLEEQLGPGVAAALARTARLLRADADLLDRLAAVALRDAELPDGGLDAHRLADHPQALRSRVLRSAALTAGCPASDLTWGHVAELDRLVTCWHGQRGVDLPGPVHGRREGTALRFRPGSVGG